MDELRKIEGTEMTMARELGTIEKVDIRQVWSNEASDFTPWLAENIELLGEALGMDLELQMQEAPVGGYSLDILAREMGSGKYVVIENQYGNTDHDHLGKLLTYAGGYDAYTAVWVSERFRDEHREALDLLNRRTGEDTAFFGVVIEVLKIDNSRPAPNFDLVVTPNEWRRQTGGTVRSGDVSSRDERYGEFWQLLIGDLVERGFITSSRRANRGNWQDFSTGSSSLMYRSTFSGGQRPRVEFYLDRGKDFNKSAFDFLIKDKEQIESALGFELSWERLDNRKASRIATYTDGSIEDSDDKLLEIRNWMVDRLLKFKEVFGPKLADLAE